MEKGEFVAFTTKYSGKINVLITEVGISTPYSPNNNTEEKQPLVIKFKAIWDTGATSCVITKNASEKLGLIPISKQEVHGVGGVKTENCYLINIYLPNKVVVPYIKVVECEKLLGDCDILIGMDVIGLGDFVVTNRDNKTTLSYRIPSVAEIDFVQDWNNYQEKDKQKLKKGIKAKRKLERKNRRKARKKK